MTEDQLKELIEKEKKNWAYDVQTKPLPSWTEAFEYALRLGLELQDSSPEGAD